MWGPEADFDKRLLELRPIAYSAPPLEWEANLGRPPEVMPQSGRTVGVSPGRRNGKPNNVDLGRYFMLPYRLFSSGLGAKLKNSAGWLYACLCSKANDHQAMTFGASDKELEADTGMSISNIRKFRAVLRDYGLIQYSTQPGHKMRYTLLKPDLERQAAKERPRAKCKPRGTSKAGIETAQVDPFGYGELPQILRGTCLNFAHPSR